MKNSYELRGNHVVVFLKKRSGDVVETIIDTDDLSLLLQLDFTWYQADGYALTMLRFTNDSRTTLMLHRLIMNQPDGFEVDHINHDTMDNRKSNLRLATKSENGQNRKGATVTNKCGVRGVHWSDRYHKWITQLKVKGKLVYYEKFASLEQAEFAIKAARAKHMPFSPEAIRKV